jgi:SAM-dependent methyltransferase
MNATPAASPTHVPQAEWFETWFDTEHYRRLYATHDEAEAARFVDRLFDRLQPREGARVLDLGCGVGRHARRIAARGFDVTGLDLAPTAIHQARQSAHRHLRFRRHDMRRPFGRNRFDCVVNMFTSFGYFDSAQEHLHVIGNIARALRPGGMLVMDYLNARYVEAHLKASEQVTIGGTSYDINRWADRTHIFKRIGIAGRRASFAREYVERVAKLTLDDFCSMCATAGLRIEDVYGSYDLTRYDEATSPRLILVARKGDAQTEGDYRRDRFLRMRLTVSGDTPRYDASIHCGTR